MNREEETVTMIKLKTIAIFLLAVLCGALAVGEKPTAAAPEQSSGGKKVKSALEFYETVGSDRTLEFTNGEFKLTDLEPVPFKYFGDKNKGGEVSWKKVFDGYELCLKGMKNLTLRGEVNGEYGPATELIVDPRYAFVISFEDCENIAIENFSAGHSKAGECEGGVFRFTNCSGVRIDNTSMYGSGTEGLLFENTTGVTVTSSMIYECIYDIMTIIGGGNISFKDSRFNNNKEFDLVTISGADGVTFEDCTFMKNSGKRMFSVDASRNISVKNTKFYDNSMGESISVVRDIDFTDCVFD
jgi:hypothetical protein